MSLLKNIFRIVFSNLMIVVSGVILGFVLPMYLSVEGYGQYRLYFLYVSYIGLLHFGFIDAMYLKYGGMKEQEVNKALLKKEHNIFTIYQLGIAMLIIILAYVMKDDILLLFALTIIPVNMGSFHKLFYQATGQFKKYSRYSILYAVLNVVLIFILIFYIKDYHYSKYLYVSLIAYFIPFIAMEIDFYKFIKGIKSTGEVNIVRYVKIGIFILIGNICVMLFGTVGSWVVKYNLSLKEFAYYSFAMSMMNIVLLVINAAGITFYNYIAEKEDQKMLCIVKDILLIIGILSGSVYFILQLIIKSLLPQYITSLNIISVSFVSFPYMMVINVIILNLYKARKQVQKYLMVVVSMLMLSVVLNVGMFFITKSLVGITFGTTLSFALWYLYATNIAFPYLKSSYKELGMLIIHAISFLTCSHYLNWYQGLIVYIIVIVSVIIVMYRKEITRLTSQFRNRKKVFST